MITAAAPAAAGIGPRSYFRLGVPAPRSAESAVPWNRERTRRAFQRPTIESRQCRRCDRLRRSLLRGFVVIGRSAPAASSSSQWSVARGVPVVRRRGRSSRHRVADPAASRRAGGEAEADHRDVLEAYDRARLDARRDPLTGLGNHRAFQEELAARWPTRTAPAAWSLVVLDLDDLKRLNESGGHAAGDQLLAAVGRLIGASLRAATARSASAATSSRCSCRDGPRDGLRDGQRLLASATGGHPILRDTCGSPFSTGSPPARGRPRPAAYLPRRRGPLLGQRHGGPTCSCSIQSRHGMVRRLPLRSSSWASR